MICFICSIVFASSIFAKPIELAFWHSMAGSLGDEVKWLTNSFNQSQTKFIIKPVYKGDYIETLTSFAAAFRAHHPPALIQIFEVGSATMLFPSGVIKPVDDIINEQGLTLPKEDFLQSVLKLYSLGDKLMAMPLNISVPILYYDKDALAKVGYNKNNFPKTWEDLEILAKSLKKAGFQCTYTTAYPGWILVESYLAIHGLPLLQSSPTRAIFNSQALQRHLTRLKTWQRQGYFKYGGRVDDATALFTSGVCPLFSQSSGAYNSLSTLVSFHLGLAVMPLDTQTSTMRHPNVTGGAALWAISGLTPIQYEGIGEFLVFLARPEIQQHWHEHTGYLPIGLQGIYRRIYQSSNHPAIKLAKNDLEPPGYFPVTHIIGPQNQIRNVNDELLESMFAGIIPVGVALQEAVTRSNHIIFRFSKNNLSD
ncbi:MAG: extracellular solute-binding protein [Legionella sp.]|nr:extracellular solute-binding protein [Legionella sp.]